MACAVGLASVVLIGCGGDDDADADTPNTAPVIDSVEGPASSAPTNGIYSIPFTLRFSDADGDPIAKVRYRIVAAGIDETKDVPSGAIGAQLILLVREGAPKQTYDVAFTAFDKRGKESAEVSRTIRLD
jgi:hypothetical protein